MLNRLQLPSTFDSTPQPDTKRSNFMTSQHASNSSIRAFVIAVALLAASVLGTSSVSADTLRPAVDMGAPAGGGGTATETVEIADNRGPVRAF